MWIKNKESIYTDTNNEYLNLFGFKNSNYLLEKSDYELPCRISEIASLIQQEDKYSVSNKKPIKLLTIVKFIEWKVLLITKSPIYDHSNSITGTLGHAVEIDNNFKQISYLLSKELTKNNNNGISQKSFSIGAQHNTSIKLTPRQSECLFLLLKNKTAKETAKILSLSSRTVEDHITQLKYIFNCQSKHELIDTATVYGFSNIIPESLFNQQLSILLE